jgi:hypothetical protein
MKTALLPLAAFALAFSACATAPDPQFQAAWHAANVRAMKRAQAAWKQNPPSEVGIATRAQDGTVTFQIWR